jgi:hypothetical protein
MRQGGTFFVVVVVIISVGSNAVAAYTVTRIILRPLSALSLDELM